MNELSIIACILSGFAATISIYTLWKLRHPSAPRKPEPSLRMPDGQPLDVRALVAVLSPLVRQALETAAEIAVQRSHAFVGNEHLFKVLVENAGSDVAVLLAHREIDLDQLAADLETHLELVPTESERVPALSQPLLQLLVTARDCASKPRMACHP